MRSCLALLFFVVVLSVAAGRCGAQGAIGYSEDAAIIIAPGIGYPTGWGHPDLIWPSTQSLGIAAYFCEPPSPVESPTWGAVKALFQK